MTQRFFSFLTTLLIAIGAWATNAQEVYNFKGLNTEATINCGDDLGFTVNNGSDRHIYSFSIEDVEMDCSRFGGFIGGATDGNFTLKTGGLLLKNRILSILNLKNGDKVTIEYKLASDAASVTLADATLIGNTTDDSFESGTEYTISTEESSVHLDIISSSNNNYIEKITITPYVETVSVFLTAGQSNTAGRCMNENLPEYIKTLGAANDGAYKYCNWSYTNGSTRKSESEGVFRKFWPEMESAKNNGRFAYDAIVYYWIEQALQKDFYVVKHAQGGTSIDPTCTSTNDYHWSADADWLAENASCNADGTSMLKAFCDNIGASLAAIEKAGKSYDIKAMIWHQGESDRTGTGPDGYHDNLKAVVKYVRDYLVTTTGDEKYATLDFICGTVPTNSKQYNKKVYDALFTLASEDEHFHVIETSPGTFIGDDLHFNTNCAERLGIGMYNKMVDLELVGGEKQTVPEADIPEDKTITLDFKTWAIENVGEDKNVQKALTLSNESIKTLDGATDIYKAVGCDAEGDFSEFAETFALSANEVKMRGNVGLQLASNKVVTFSILNLNPGDGVTITFGAGSSGTTTLAALSENIFLSTDKTKTVLEKSTALTSKVTYAVKSGTQIDLTFGSTGGHYINSIVITPGLIESNEMTLTESEGLTTLEQKQNEEISIFFSRTFANGKASTLCLPFDCTPGDVGTFATFTGVDEGNSTVYMTATATNLTAGTPYLFIPNTAEEITFQNTAYTVPAEGFTAAGVTNQGNWHFKGTYENMTWSAGQTTLYGLAGADFTATNEEEVEVGAFVRFNAGTTPAFRAYMYYGNADPSSSARNAVRSGITSQPERMRVMLIGLNGSITEIGTIQVEYEENGIWYTLDGCRLKGKPTLKGMYIHNGKTVAVN